MATENIIMKVMTLNIQNGVSTTRGYWHYLLSGWKYVLPHSTKGIKI